MNHWRFLGHNMDKQEIIAGFHSHVCSVCWSWRGGGPVRWWAPTVCTAGLRTQPLRGPCAACDPRSWPDCEIKQQLFGVHMLPASHLNETLIERGSYGEDHISRVSRIKIITTDTFWVIFYHLIRWKQGWERKIHQWPKWVMKPQ